MQMLILSFFFITKTKEANIIKNNAKKGMNNMVITNPTEAKEYKKKVYSASKIIARITQMVIDFIKISPFKLLDECKKYVNS